MTKHIIGFYLRLSFILIGTFSIHLLVLNYLKKPLFENRIILAYVLNFILAGTIYHSLFLLRKKYLDILGFVFMGGSLIKFLVFFLFFFPVYRENGDINMLEATSFLAPYLLCLIIETLYLSKLLNKST